jgi:hypothetical protein
MVIKKGVDVRFLCKQITHKLFNIESIFKYHAPDPYVFTITSGADGKHRENSKHYTFEAIDCRVWYYDITGIEFIDRDVLEKIVHELSHFLGDDFDVVLENTHIHIEYDPEG